MQASGVSLQRLKRKNRTEKTLLAAGAIRAPRTRPTWRQEAGGDPSSSSAGGYEGPKN